MSSIALSGAEEEQLYVLLKQRERELPQSLSGLLRRIERSLYARSTVEEMERLAARLSADH